MLFSSEMSSVSAILGSVWTLVAAVVGSCSVLLVSFMSLWHSRRQLRLQFEQQSRESKLAREMSLRREVYLEAAVAVARATSSLNELADVSFESKELARQFAADFACIAKVHVVGTPETIEALMGVTRELGNAQAELNAARIPMAERQHRMEAAPLGSDERATLSRAYTEARLELAELAMNWAGTVARHVPAAIAAIRRELDMPLQMEHYRQSFERSWAHSQEHLRRRIEMIRAELKASPRLLP
jgi:hypothetical protein